MSSLSVFEEGVKNFEKMVQSKEDELNSYKEEYECDKKMYEDMYNDRIAKLASIYEQGRQINCSDFLRSCCENAEKTFTRHYSKQQELLKDQLEMIECYQKDLDESKEDYQKHLQKLTEAKRRASKI